MMNASSHFHMSAALDKVESTDFTNTSDFFMAWFVEYTSATDFTPSFSKCVLSPVVSTLETAEQMSFGE